MNWRRSRKVLVRGWRDVGICPLICLPEVFLEQTHIFQKYYLRKMHHAIKEISPVTTVNICCWKFALSFTSLSSTTMFFLCTEVLSFQDDLHTYQFLLATPWRRCRLLRNSCMGSDDLFPLSDGGVCHTVTTPHPLCFSAKPGQGRTLILLCGGCGSILTHLPCRLSHLRGENLYHQSCWAAFVASGVFFSSHPSSPLCKTHCIV